MNELDGIVLIIAGLSIAFFRKGYARKIVEFQNSIGFHFGQKIVKIDEWLGLAFGLLLVVLGFLSIFGIKW